MRRRRVEEHATNKPYFRRLFREIDICAFAIRIIIMILTMFTTCKAAGW